jgi:hypothetical protein
MTRMRHAHFADAAVRARVSMPARPTTPRRFIQPSKSLSLRQLAGSVGASRKIAPRAEVSDPPPICSTSSTLVPVFPTCGKVKARIWLM